MSRALEEASHMPILMFLKSRVENAKALRWKEVGHAGGRARRLERLQVESRGG